MTPWWLNARHSPRTMSPSFDGSPTDARDGVMPDDYHHRISAAALRRSRPGDHQRPRADRAAAVTAAGTEYLDQVDGPEPPIPRPANASVTQQLVNDVIAGGGVLRVPRKSCYDRDAIDYVRRAQLAERHRKVPDGKLLVTSTLRDGVEIRLIDVETEGASPTAIELLPVPVPERVARYHAAARSFRDHTDLHEVSRDQLQRATRILHAIATEAQPARRFAAGAYGRVDVNTRRTARHPWRAAKTNLPARCPARVASRIPSP